MADDQGAGEGEGEGEGEEFSFPSIVGSLPCSIDSPPWLYSPSNRTGLEGVQDKNGELRVTEEALEKNNQGVNIVADASIRDGSREEKMDMLWEDFNEELWGSSAPREKCQESREFGGGKTGLSKGSIQGAGAVLSSPAKRPGAVGFVKALRKLFLLRRGTAAAPGPGPCSIKAHHHRRPR